MKDSWHKNWPDSELSFVFIGYQILRCSFPNVSIICFSKRLSFLNAYMDLILNGNVNVQYLYIYAKKDDTSYSGLHAPSCKYD